MTRPSPPGHLPGNPHGYPDYTWPMVWVLQDNMLWPAEQWAAHVGDDKLWSGNPSVAAGGAPTYTIYTVPAGKVLYVVRAILSSERQGRFTLYYTLPTTNLTITYISAYNAYAVPLTPPVVIGAGKTLYLVINNYDTTAGLFPYTIAAFEVAV